MNRDEWNKVGKALIHLDYCIPKELYDKLRNSEDPLSHWSLGSPYALPNDAPEEVEAWGRRMQERVLNTPSIFDKQRIKGVANDCQPPGLE